MLYSCDSVMLHNLVVNLFSDLGAVTNQKGKRLGFGARES